MLFVGGADGLDLLDVLFDVHRVQSQHIEDSDRAALQMIGEGKVRGKAVVIVGPQ